MKKVLFSLLLLTANSSFALEECTQYDAQIIATARSVEPLANGQCRVMPAWTGNWQLNSSYICPLDIDEVSSFGMIMSCDIKVGDVFSGIVYRKAGDNSDSLYLY